MVIDLLLTYLLTYLFPTWRQYYFGQNKYYIIATRSDYIVFGQNDFTVTVTT